MPADHAEPDSFVDAAASLLGLEIRPEWRDAVLANLRANAAAAQLVLEFPLADELDSAPVFRA